MWRAFNHEAGAYMHEDIERGLRPPIPLNHRVDLAQSWQLAGMAASGTSHGSTVVILPEEGLRTTLVGERRVSCSHMHHVWHDVLYHAFMHPRSLLLQP